MIICVCVEVHKYIFQNVCVCVSFYESVWVCAYCFKEPNSSVHLIKQATILPDNLKDYQMLREGVKISFLTVTSRSH